MYLPVADFLGDRQGRPVMALGGAILTTGPRERPELKGDMVALA